MRRRLAAYLVIAAALLLSAGAAFAHSPPAVTPTVPEAPIAALRPDIAPPSSLAILLVTLASLAAIGSRRRLAIALVVIFAVVAADGAVHSVHHLNEGNSAAHCALAFCFTQTPVLTSAAVSVVTRPEAASDAAIERTQGRMAVGISRPDRGRAPPSSAA
jgi:hypothetical protein